MSEYDFMGGVFLAFIFIIVFLLYDGMDIFRKTKTYLLTGMGTCLKVTYTYLDDENGIPVNITKIIKPKIKFLSKTMIGGKDYYYIQDPIVNHYLQPSKHIIIVGPNDSIPVSRLINIHTEQGESVQLSKTITVKENQFETSPKIKFQTVSKTRAAELT